MSIFTIKKIHIYDKNTPFVSIFTIRIILNPCIFVGNLNIIFFNRISGVMVRVLALSSIDRGFKPWSGQTKNYKIAAILAIMCVSTFKTAVILYITAVRFDISQGNFQAIFFFIETASMMLCLACSPQVW